LVTESWKEGRIRTGLQGAITGYEVALIQYNTLKRLLEFSSKQLQQHTITDSTKAVTICGFSVGPNRL
jgi:hypothetical protein